jgi:hypothetical protein
VILAADPPPVVVTVPADKPAEVVVSRDTRSDILASRDTPLTLIKGRRTEDALLRQTLFLTVGLTGVRPAAADGQEVLRWTYAPYLQRQLCFTSITGQFSCAAVEVEELAQKATGEAPQPSTPDQTAPGPNPAAEAVRTAVAADLRGRADALFDDDRRLKLDPMLKAAGVSQRRPPVGAGAVHRGSERR